MTHKRIEIASVICDKKTGEVIGNLGFVLPRCSYLAPRLKNWQFFSSGVVRDARGLVAQREAIRAMKQQLEQWLFIIDRAIRYEAAAQPTLAPDATPKARLRE